MHPALWQSYWVGLAPTNCGVYEWTHTATEEKTTLVLTSLVMNRRPLDSVVESCYYLIQANTDEWESSSEILIWLTSYVNAEMHVWRGSDRRNASLVVEANSTMAIGAPVRIPVSEGAIVTLRVADLKQNDGKATFSYMVSGTRYRWYERPFVNNLHIYFYYIMIGVIGSGLFWTFVGCPLSYLSLTLFSFCYYTHSALHAMCFACCYPCVERWHKAWKKE